MYLKKLFTFNNFLKNILILMSQNIYDSLADFYFIEKIISITTGYDILVTWLYPKTDIMIDNNYNIVLKNMIEKEKT